MNSKIIFAGLVGVLLGAVAATAFIKIGPAGKTVVFDHISETNEDAPTAQGASAAIAPAVNPFDVPPNGNDRGSAKMVPVGGSARGSVAAAPVGSAAISPMVIGGTGSGYGGTSGGMPYRSGSVSVMPYGPRSSGSAAPMPRGSAVGWTGYPPLPAASAGTKSSPITPDRRLAELESRAAAMEKKIEELLTLVQKLSQRP